LLKKLIIVLLSVPVFITAQVLLPTTETAFEKQHNFNPDIIKKKGIRKITFEIIDKKDFEVAVDKNLVETYEFNGDGLLSRYFYTNLVKSVDRVVAVRGHGKHKKSSTTVITDYVYDTISTSYFYSGKNLVLKRYHDGANYYESRYYRYDNTGNLTKELRYKETNNSSDKSFFMLGNQLQLSEDSFQYAKFKSGQIKCVFLNNENRSYKERITNVDSLGNKILINEYFTVAAWIMQESRFEYAGNRLVMARFEGNASSRVILKNTYDYDTNNELYTEKQYKNDVLLKEISYVSDRNNGLLNSFVIRDPATKSLRIVRLKYDFGMIGQNGK
jgi:hypothetical protein